MAQQQRNYLNLADQLYRQRAWSGAYQAFCAADQQDPLDAGDLEQLAMATYLLGRDEEYLATLERAHHAWMKAGRNVCAVRCAFWLGFRLLMRNETGRATGWLTRAERLLARESHECPERGYLLLPVIEQRLSSGDFESAYAMAGEAAAIGERCGDADLVASARHQQGRSRLQQDQVAAGLALLDEVMLSVTSGQLSPLMTGLMYCSVIAACQQVYAIERSREWTAALSHWCDDQPDMIAFTGTCRVHRAEILQIQGEWLEAIAEASRAIERSQALHKPAAAAAFYQQAEVHRLKGEFAAAEEAYTSASQFGLEPQPGLALLRLAQGRADAAVAAIQRAEAASPNPSRRMTLLPATVEIMLAAGHIDKARNACDELQLLAARFASGTADALAAQAMGAVRMAEGDAHAALGPLRRALEIWQRIPAPHAAARVRELTALACRALGDEDGAELELLAARTEYARLGAAMDLARADALARTAASSATHGLTRREQEVLRLVATGDTNKSIASKLSLSEKTIERHVGNILEKLGVPSRTAATTYAHEHRLL